MNKLDLGQLMVCHIIMKAAGLICQNHSWNEVNFVLEWLNCETIFRLVDEDETLICQGGHYIFHNMEKEIVLPEKTGHVMRSDAVEWIMYLLMYWIYLENVSPREIAEKYDIAEILAQYDVLHTESVKSAICYIKHNYSKVEVLKDSLRN